jgi:uncharacterized protein (TIGR03790 family)
MPFRCFCAFAACLFASVLRPDSLLAQSGANVLVVANEASPSSVEIAEYYAQRRQVPAEQLLKIRTSVADQVSRVEFDRTIHSPIAEWLARTGSYDRILYIVLTKGVPLRVAGQGGGRTTTIASVDSELTLLYRRATGQPVSPNGNVPNPYFLGDSQASAARRFSHVAQDIFLVTRLDGFSTADVKALIDRGLAPATNGRVILDQRAGITDKPNDWLAAAAKKLDAQGLGDRVVLEQTSRLVESQKDVLGYYSWGSNDPALMSRAPSVGFAPGALAALFVSTDARTFTEPPAEWKPGPWESKQSYHAGSPQSLTGDLVRAGVTGAAGYVNEPYLDTSIRPDILFPAYFAGFNLAEAFYLALPALSWQSVIIGDPLCAPFARTSVPAAELDPPVDKETELPSLFSARRIAGIRLKGDPAALKLVVKAEARTARDDRAGARQAYEEAVSRDESLAVAWRELGKLYDDAKDPAKAAAAYRKAIAGDPQDWVSLNNLAYIIAVTDGKPADALGFAEKALQLSGGSALVADTVGWIKHLSGDDAGAVKLLAPASKALRTNADVQLHAAVVFAAVGRLEEAAAALKTAEAADPNVKSRPEYREAQQKIGR